MKNTLSFTHRYLPGTGDHTLLVLHGTGGNEDDLIPLTQSLAPGATILSPRGKVLENGMPRFFRRLGEGVFDLEDLKARTHELADFVNEASETYGFDSSKLIALGFSNGANIASSLMLLRPEVLKSGVLLRPMLPLEPDTLPDLSGVRVLLANGRADPIVPHESVERLSSLLKEAGAEVTQHWSAASHGLVQADVEAAQGFLKTLL